MRKKQLTNEIIDAIELKVFLLLCESAEVQLTKKEFIWNVNEPYYAQAFGVLQTMVILNYCTYGATNIILIKINMNWWFDNCKDLLKTEIETNGLKPTLDKYRKLNSNAKRN